MGRLIDDIALKASITVDEILETNKPLEDIIDEQSTAYDVEAVVKEIRDIGTRFCVSVHCNNECNCCDHGSIMKSVIEIVRNGGVK